MRAFQESSALVTHGVFKMSRNPMYSGMLLILVGIALLLGTLTPWCVIPLLAVILDVIFIRPEETMLEERFREGFQEYKKEVRRWI